MERIPVSGPSITRKEIDYVTDAVTNAWYGSANVWPNTVVRRSMDGVDTAPRGLKPTSSNTRTFSRSVRSSSAPPSMKSKTERGRRRRAARRS